MLISVLDGTAMRAARAALDGLTRRHEAISANVANIDTPGYQRREVRFEQALRDSLRSAGAGTPMAATHPAHVSAPSARGLVLGGPEPRDLVASRNDGNTVSIDEEMALLAETQIRYQALTQGIGRRLSTLRTAIRG